MNKLILIGALAAALSTFAAADVTSVAQPVTRASYAFRSLELAQSSGQPSSTAPQLVTPFNSFSGEWVGIDSKHWAAVVASPYAIWPVAPFKFAGHTFTGVSIQASLLAGAIFAGGQFTAGQELGLHYSWHPSDFVGVGVAQLYSALKPEYRPYVEVGWKF